VPTDGSEHAVRAAEHGLFLARAFDATVHVVNVVDVQAAAGPFGAGGVDQAYVDRLEAEGERTVEAVTAVAEAADAVETAIVRGRPTDAILDYVDAHGVDLIAMGTHGRTGVERYVAGSVAERVVRRSDVPVLTARATDRSRVGDGYEEVLVPTDGSEAATRAVEHAVAVASRTDARVHAVSLVDVGGFAAGPDYNPPIELVHYLEEAGERATERVAERARAAGVEVVTAVREGSPARGLLDYADEHDVDLVAMATAGRTGLSRYLLGSTTERVVRHADVPVLTVAAREELAE
jgi:nucleotide-binding universal stress UspA family protein